MISYTITALYPILKVKEAASGTGGLCGSTFLNRRFGEFLTNKLENVEGWDDELFAEAMERFDSVVCTSLISFIWTILTTKTDQEAILTIYQHRRLHNSRSWSSQQRRAWHPSWSSHNQSLRNEHYLRAYHSQSY